MRRQFGTAVEDRRYLPVTIRLTAAALRAENVSDASLLQHAGVDPLVLNSPHARVSCSEMLRVFSEAIRLSAQPNIGLIVGSNAKVATMGIYGYALLSSPSHALSLRLSSRYDNIVAPFAPLEDHIIDGIVVRNFSPVVQIPKFDDLYRFVVELKLSAIYTAMNELYGRTVQLNRISVAYDPKFHLDSYMKYFNCPIDINSNTNSISFDSAILNETMTYPSIESNTIIQEICESLNKTVSNNNDFTRKIRMYLLDFPTRRPTSREVCDHFAIGERTFRRRLEEDNTNFREITAEVEAALIDSYLRLTDIPLSEIAELLGYKQVSHFASSVKRLIKSTPTEYRRTIRARR